MRIEYGRNGHVPEPPERPPVPPKRAASEVPAGPEWLKPGEAAALLRISPTTLRRAVRAGSIPAFIEGQTMRILRSDLRPWYATPTATTKAGEETS